MAVRKSLAWMGLAQFASFVTQFAATIVLARFLTPFEVGVSAIAFAIIGFVSIFQQLGLPSLVIRAEVLSEDLSRTAFTINAVVTTLLSLVIVLTSFAGASILREDGVGHVLLVLSVVPMFGIVSFLPAAVLERDGRFREIALVTTVTSLIGAVATIVFVVAGASYMSVAYSFVLSSGLSAGALAVIGRAHIQHRMSFRAWRSVSVFGAQILAVSGVNTAAWRISEIVLGKMLGLSALGLFNRANGINSILWNNIHIAVGRVALVQFSDLHRQGLSLRDPYLRTVAIITVLLWPAFAGLAVIAHPFVRLVFGNQWLPAVRPFELIAVSSMILASITMTWELFTATGELATQTRIEFVRAFFAAVAFAIGCLISLEAAAMARIIDALFSFFMYRQHVYRMTDTSSTDFRPIYAGGLLATGAAVTPAAILITIDGPDPAIPLLVASIVLGAGLWLATVFALQHPIADELSGMTRLVRRGARVAKPELQ